jgi:hypothetical protein
VLSLEVIIYVDFLGIENFLWEKYNLAIQTTTLSLNDPPNYQDLHFSLRNYQAFEKCTFWRNIPRILLACVIFKLKNLKNSTKNNKKKI